MTGEPRPPRAPVSGGAKTVEKVPAGAPPKPPPDRGPALEYYREPESDAMGVGAAVFVVMVAAFTLYNFLTKGLTVSAAFGWMSIWWLWLFPVVTGLLLYWVRRGSLWAAGADWLRTASSWVRTYELVSVKGMVVGTGVRLEMSDRAGNGLSVIVSDLQRNPKVWDLVYNGILHSVVAGGAKTNRLALGLLRIDEGQIESADGPRPEPDSFGQRPASARRMSALARWVSVALLVIGCALLAMALVAGLSDALSTSERTRAVLTTGCLGVIFLAIVGWLRFRSRRKS